MENKENELPLSGENGEADETLELIASPQCPSEPGTPDIANDLVMSDDSENDSEFVSDFDVMWERKKAAKHRRRHLADYHMRMVGRLIQDMRDAVVEDRELIMANQPATKKIGMLKEVIEKISKPEMQQMFIDNDILEVLTDWLVPLKNYPRPSFHLVHSILQVLDTFPAIEKAQLKESRIGKAVMYYYKLPDVEKGIRDLAQKIVYYWSRPVHNISCDSNLFSIEERRSKDLEILDSIKHSIDDVAAHQPVSKKMKTFFDIVGSMEEKADKDGYYVRHDVMDNTPRARIPMPSTKTYYVRPESKINPPLEEGKKKRKRRKKEAQLFSI